MRQCRIFFFQTFFSVLAIEIYLTNFIPPYQDECFSFKAVSMLKHKLEQVDYKNLIFHGVVALQLANTLWLNEVYEEKILSDGSIIPGLQLAKEALKLQLVQFDESQFKRLKISCESTGISIPTPAPQQKSLPNKKEKVLPQWAHLDIDNPNEVLFSSAVSPDEFYVRLNKFNDL